jgi:hypothetical protein
MAVGRLKKSVPSRCHKARSSLVRRLLQASDDPAKQRIRHWLSDINDEQLLSFGLTVEDIALLRGRPEAQSPETAIGLFQYHSLKRRRS